MATLWNNNHDNVLNVKEQRKCVLYSHVSHERVRPNTTAGEVTPHRIRRAGPTNTRPDTYLGGDSSSVPCCPVLPEAEPRGAVARRGHRSPD